MKTKPNGLLNRDEVRAFQVKRAPLYYVELLSYSNKEYLVRKATLADYDWVHDDHNKGLFVFSNYWQAWAFAASLQQGLRKHD